MSSTARGSQFEERVFTVIKNELEGGRLGVIPHSTRAYRGKSYFSRDRDADIKTDISLEVWLPDADRWSILWVIECKDYQGAIPVNDVEEFKAKLDQISGANRKGMLVVSGALQEGAINYARAHGIAVVRLLPNEQIRVVLHQMTSAMFAGASKLNRNEFRRAFTQSDFNSDGRNFYGAIDGYLVGSWTALLRRALNAPGTSSTLPPSPSPPT